MASNRPRTGAIVYQMQTGSALANVFGIGHIPSRGNLRRLVKVQLHQLRRITLDDQPRILYQSYKGIIELGIEYDRPKFLSVFGVKLTDVELEHCKVTIRFVPRVWPKYLAECQASSVQPSPRRSRLHSVQDVACRDQKKPFPERGGKD